MHVHMRCATTSRLPATRCASNYVAALAASVWTATQPRCRLFLHRNFFHRLYRHAGCHTQSTPPPSPLNATRASKHMRSSPPCMCASNNVCIQCMLRTRLHCFRLRCFRLLHCFRLRCVRLLHCFRLRCARLLHRQALVILPRCWSWLWWRPFPRICFFGSLRKWRSKDTLQ